MKSYKCDVLVVGAGPAGAVCASKLAKEGLEVICIDKGKRPGSFHTSKIDITESKGIEKIIKELKLDYLSKTNKSIWYSPNDKFTFVSSVHDLFFLRGTSKDSLDYSLFLAMKENSVDIWFDSSVQKADFYGKSIGNLLISKNKKQVLIKPKIVVVATGNDSYFSKNLGLKYFEETQIAGFGALMSNLRMENNTTAIFFDSIYAPGGYFFVGKVSNDIGIAMLVVNKKLAKKKIDKMFYEFSEKNPELYGILLGAKTISFNSGERTLSKMSSYISKNVAFVGDTARTMSPVFAYGVNPAIRTGYMLAEKIIQHGLDENALKEYGKEMRKIFKNQNFGYRLRKTYDNLTNTDLDFIVETANYLHKKQHLDKLVDSDEYKIEHIIQAILRKPHKMIKLFFKGLY